MLGDDLRFGQKFTQMLGANSFRASAEAVFELADPEALRVRAPIRTGFWLCAEETLRRCRSIRSLDKIVVHGRQRFELVVADPVQTMMAQRQMPVSSLDTGTGSLEEMGTV